MSRVVPDRLIVLVVLASFLGANTVGLLHDHSHGKHSHGHHDGPGLDHPWPEADHDEADHVGLVADHDDGHAAHGGDCVVCSYLAERVLSVVPGVAWQGDLCLTLDCAPADAPKVAFAHAARSRAPPLPC